MIMIFLLTSCVMPKDFSHGCTFSSRPVPLAVQKAIWPGPEPNGICNLSRVQGKTGLERGKIAFRLLNRKFSSLELGGWGGIDLWLWRSLLQSESPQCHGSLACCSVHYPLTWKAADQPWQVVTASSGQLWSWCSMEVLWGWSGVYLMRNIQIIIAINRSAFPMCQHLCQTLNNTKHL